MMCSERDSTSKVYDKNRKKYVVKKEVIGSIYNGWFEIKPEQLKECISPFVAKFYYIEMMNYALKVWKWGAIDELGSNGVFPSRISTHLLPW